MKRQRLGNGISKELDFIDFSSPAYTPAWYWVYEYLGFPDLYNLSMSSKNLCMHLEKTRTDLFPEGIPLRWLMIFKKHFKRNGYYNRDIHEYVPSKWATWTCCAGKRFDIDKLVVYEDIGKNFLLTPKQIKEIRIPKRSYEKCTLKSAIMQSMKRWKRPSAFVRELNKRRDAECEKKNAKKREKHLKTCMGFKLRIDNTGDTFWNTRIDEIVYHKDRYFIKPKTSKMRTNAFQWLKLRSGYEKYYRWMWKNNQDIVERKMGNYYGQKTKEWVLNQVRYETQNMCAQMAMWGSIENSMCIIKNIPIYFVDLLHLDISGNA